MKYTKKETPRKQQKQRDATFEKFKKQQNELNASRRGVRRKWWACSQTVAEVAAIISRCNAVPEIIGNK